MQIQLEIFTLINVEPNLAPCVSQIKINSRFGGKKVSYFGTEAPGFQQIKTSLGMYIIAKFHVESFLE